MNLWDPVSRARLYEREQSKRGGPMDRAQVEHLPTGEHAVMDWEAPPSESPCLALTDDERRATNIADLLNRGEVDRAMKLAGQRTSEDLIRNG
jgi:hypothetical protein